MAISGNLVYQFTNGTGSGNLILGPESSDSPSQYFRNFSDVFGTGSSNKFYYSIRNRNLIEFEVGIGYMSSSTVLVRDSVIESSNANALVDFTSGPKDVISDMPASIQNTIQEKVASVSDDGGGYITVDNTDPTNPIVGFDATPLDSYFLKLDQATPQHIINGAPVFDGGIELGGGYVSDSSSVPSVDPISRILYTSDGLPNSYPKPILIQGTFGGWCGIATSANGQIVLSRVYGSGSNIFISTDAGVTLNDTGVPTNGFGAAISDNGAVMLVVDIGGTVQVSTNTGATWATTLTMGSGWSQTMSSSGQIMYVTSGIVLQKSTDFGASWSVVATSFSAHDVVTDKTGNLLLASDSVGDLYYSNDGGATFINRGQGSHSWQCLAASKDFKYIIASYPSVTILSSDYGVTWADTGQGATAQGALSYDGSIISLAGMGGNINISTDSGVTWQNIPVSAGSGVYSTALSEFGNNLFVGAFNGDFQYSINNIFYSADWENKTLLEDWKIGNRDIAGIGIGVSNFNNDAEYVTPGSGSGIFVKLDQSSQQQVFGGALDFNDGIKFSGGMIIDVNNLNSIDPNARTLIDLSGNPVINWDGLGTPANGIYFIGGASNNLVVPGGIWDTGSQQVFDVNARQLFDPAGSVLIDFSNTLNVAAAMTFDASTNGIAFLNTWHFEDTMQAPSLDVNARLISTGLYNVIDYSGNVNADPNVAISFDGGGLNRIMVNWPIEDALGALSLNTTTRVLYDDNGSPAFLWSASLGSGGVVQTAGILVVGNNIQDTAYLDSLDPNLRTLYDNSEIQSLEWSGRKMFDPSGSFVTADWGQRFLYDPGGAFLSVDWGNRELYDSNSTYSVRWNYRYLVDDNFGVSVDWQGRSAYDSSAVLSFDWASRSMFSNVGAGMIDYSQSFMPGVGLPSGIGSVANFGATVIDAESAHLNDGSSIISIDWIGRYLADDSGIPSVDYQNRYLNTSTFGAAVNWGLGTLNYNTGGSTQATVDWFNQQLVRYDGTNPYTVSIDWSNRKLIGVDGSTVMFDWGTSGYLNAEGNILTGVSLIEDPSNFGAIDLTNRLLQDLGNVNALNFDSRTLLVGSTIMFDWATPGVLDAKTNLISNVVDPVSAQDAATKSYVDSLIGGGSAGAANQLQVSDGTGGFVAMPMYYNITSQIGDSTNAVWIAYDSRLLYATNGTSPMLNFANPGTIDVLTNNIIDMADPVNPQDAATKAYVDTNIASKLPSVVASGGATGQTANVTLCTATSPVSGSYEIGGWINVTALTLGTVALQVTYNDDTGASRTMSVPLSSLAGAVAATGASVAPFSAVISGLQTNGSANIVVKVTVTTFTGTFNAYGWVKRIV